MAVERLAGLECYIKSHETGGVNPSSREGYSQTGDWMAPKQFHKDNNRFPDLGAISLQHFLVIPRLIAVGINKEMLSLFYLFFF